MTMKQTPQPVQLAPESTLPSFCAFRYDGTATSGAVRPPRGDARLRLEGHRSGLGNLRCQPTAQCGPGPRHHHPVGDHVDRRMLEGLQIIQRYVGLVDRWADHVRSSFSSRVPWAARYKLGNYLPFTRNNVASPYRQRRPTLDWNSSAYSPQTPLIPSGILTSRLDYALVGIYVHGSD